MEDRSLPGLIEDKPLIVLAVFIVVNDNVSLSKGGWEGWERSLKKGTEGSPSGKVGSSKSIYRTTRGLQCYEYTVFAIVFFSGLCKSPGIIPIKHVLFLFFMLYFFLVPFTHFITQEVCLSCGILL